MGWMYLYGIVEAGEDAALGTSGIDGGSPVWVLAGDGLGCVVSDYGGQEFGALSREEIVRALLAHQQVVEHAMRGHTVLPVKFGTLLASPAEGRAMLLQARPQLAMALASIQDKVEIEVAATWDTARVLQQISEDEEVVRARRAIPDIRQATLQERLRLGQLAKECMDRRRECYRERMMELLRPLAVDFTQNALVSDELVMNVAFLVEASRQPEFDERVGRLDQLFQEQINFRIIGPLPPYSFSTVEVTRLTDQQIEEARDTLQLGEEISEAGVRRAYRRLAAEEQRYLAAGDELAKVRFAQLRRASDLLLRYCLLRQEAPPDNGGRNPLEGSATGQFVVAIRRSTSDDVDPARYGAAVKARPT